MKRKLYSRLSGILVMVMIMVMVPVYSFGATKTLKDDSYNEFHLGQNYEVTINVGKQPMYSCIECEKNEDLYLKKVTNSDSSVAEIRDFEGDGVDEYIELKGKKSGVTKVTITGSNGKKSIFTVTVGAPKIKANSVVYKSSKKVKVTANNVQKGDRIQLKIGKKTYTKKITKNANKKTLTFKITKPGFYGKKFNLYLVRKGKTKAKYSSYVYLSDTVYVGYTKKQVKWLKYWNDPDRKNKYATGEQWCYEWDGEDAYLYFNNKGVVTNWQIFEH